MTVYLVMVLTQSSMQKYVSSTHERNAETRVHHPMHNVIIENSMTAYNAATTLPENSGSISM